MSPTLFNLYIEDLLEELDKITKNNTNNDNYI